MVVEHQSLPWLRPEFESNDDWHLGGGNDARALSLIPALLHPLFEKLEILEPVVPGLGERARAPRCECSRCKSVDSHQGVSISTTFGDYDSIKPSRTEGLTDHQALVCMSHMFGFILKERSYGKCIQFYAS